MIACEWNPNAVEALQKNLDLNGVADRCQVLEGDCTLTAPKVPPTPYTRPNPLCNHCVLASDMAVNKANSYLRVSTTCHLLAVHVRPHDSCG